MSLSQILAPRYTDFCISSQTTTQQNDGMDREGLKKADFFIGFEFWTASGQWRCTDVGTRTIAAIKLDKADLTWYNGPPYAVCESVFDEYDFGGCSRTRF